MPELATPRPYNLPGVAYRAPETPSFAAPQIVPDLQGAAAVRGSSAALGVVAETLAQLPQLVTAGLAAGRKEAQQKQVHGIKMNALAGGISPAQIKALEGFNFGADDSLTYKPIDPALAQLGYDAKRAEIEYRKAAAKRAANGAPAKPTLYDKITGAEPAGALANVGDPDAMTDILPPLDPETAVAPPAPGTPVTTTPVAPRLPQNPEELAAFSGVAGTQPPLPSEPALGALAQVAPPEIPALANFGAGATTAPLPDTPAPALAQPAAPVTTAATPPKDGIVKPTTPGEAVEYWRDGKLTHVLLPGANTWQQAAPPKPEGATFATKAEAEAAGYDTAGAQVNADGSITVKKIPNAKEQQIPATLAKEARDLGLTAYGKSPATVEEEIINYRKAQNILAPEQVKNVNALQTKLSSDVAYKDIQNVKQAYTAMQGSQKEDSAIGDVALINSFQRIIDPGVSVREGDVALIQRSSGILEQIKNLPEVWTGNARIPEKMRQQMIALGRDVYESKVKNFYDSKGKAIIEQAKAYNIPPDQFDMLGLDFGIPIPGLQVPGAQPAPNTTKVAPNGKPAEGSFIIGQRYRGKDGTIRTYLGGPIGDESNWGI